MATTVVFDILSDDEVLRAALEDVKGDPVMTWRLALFCAQQQIERALRNEAIREHYDTIRKRAKATREART